MTQVQLTGRAADLAQQYQEILERKSPGRYASQEDYEQVIAIENEMAELGYIQNADRDWVTK